MNQQSTPSTSSTASPQSSPSTVSTSFTANSASCPRCTVGLLTWNAGGDGPACARALAAQAEPLQIDWIDNASTDDTARRIREAWPAGAASPLPEAQVNPRNLGFCVPHNQMLARCRTPYYLALNQDVVLEPDYIARLCDWLDGEPELALVSGVMLFPSEGTNVPPRVHSAGLVYSRLRRHFQLGYGAPWRGAWAGRRRVSGVDGAAMLLRVDACRRAALNGDEIFPAGFFAYSEEIDLAQRLARLGLGCGVDGEARAWHRGKGSGGHAQTAIRARFFANHWLVTLRNDPWGLILRELPWIVRGEVQYWLPEYLRAPAAFVQALGVLIGQAVAARRFYHAFERANGPTLAGLSRCRRMALAALRSSKDDDAR